MCTSPFHSARLSAGEARAWHPGPDLDRIRRDTEGRRVSAVSAPGGARRGRVDAAPTEERRGFSRAARATARTARRSRCELPPVDLAMTGGSEAAVLHPRHAESER